MTERGLFIPGMQGWSNFQKQIKTIRHFNSMKQTQGIHVSTYRKAFYGIQGPLTISTLAKQEYVGISSKRETGLCTAYC